MPQDLALPVVGQAFWHQSLIIIILKSLTNLPLGSLEGGFFSTEGDSSHITLGRKQTNKNTTRIWDILRGLGGQMLSSEAATLQDGKPGV